MNTELSTMQSMTPMQITEANLKEMAEQRAFFKAFVRDQLHERVDFGTLPGTEKPSLWKPGAEKIANIFQLGSRIVNSERILEIDKNFAMFSYTIEMFHIPTGRAIAQCEGVTNSQEKKWKERQEYEWIGEPGKKRKIAKGPPTPTPVADVLNTLAKMAQKRAYVGAVIIATKASDFFNHDLSEEEEDFFEKNQPQEAEKTPPTKTPSPQKERAKFETKAQVNAEAKGEFDNFKTSQVSGPKPNDERQILGNEMNTERNRLGWGKEQLEKFVLDNFKKLPPQLDLNEFKILIDTMKRQVKQ